MSIIIYRKETIQKSSELWLRMRSMTSPWLDWVLVEANRPCYLKRNSDINTFRHCMLLHPWSGISSFGEKGKSTSKRKQHFGFLVSGCICSNVYPGILKNYARLARFIYPRVRKGKPIHREYPSLLTDNLGRRILITNFIFIWHLITVRELWLWSFIAWFNMTHNLCL